MLDIGNPGIYALDLDEKRYTKTLDRIMGEITRQAAREWLKAILKSVPSRGGFPVLTGAAKSTLVPLGRFLKRVGNIEVNPVIGDRRAMGESSQSFDLIDDRSNPGKYRYSFSWSTDLVWYYINEYAIAVTGVPGVNPNPVKSAPWGTLEAGREAFESYIYDTIQRRLPAVAEDLLVFAPSS